MRMTFSGVVLGYLAGKFPHVSCIHWISLAYAGTHFMEVPDNFWPKNWRRRFPEKNGGPADLKNMVATSNLPSSNSTYSYGKWTIDDLPTKHHDLPYSSITTWHWRKPRVYLSPPLNHSSRRPYMWVFSIPRYQIQAVWRGFSTFFCQRSKRQIICQQHFWGF